MKLTDTMATFFIGKESALFTTVQSRGDPPPPTQAFSHQHLIGHWGGFIALHAIGIDSGTRVATRSDGRVGAEHKHVLNGDFATESMDGTR